MTTEQEGPIVHEGDDNIGVKRSDEELSTELDEKTSEPKATSATQADHNAAAKPKTTSAAKTSFTAASK